jgi:hypothetical protein
MGFGGSKPLLPAGGGVFIWPEGQSDEQITVQRQAGVPVCIWGGRGTVESVSGRIWGQHRH